MSSVWGSQRAPRPPAARPLVIAHRGASAAVPEHTLAAYEAAIAAGVDGVECDVRLTADGHVVCVHDRRVDRTSDGIGAVSALELADLEALDFAVARGAVPELPADRGPRGVLTLDALLSLLCDAARPLEIAIETKHPTRYAGRVERRVVDTLRRFAVIPGATRQRVVARVMSFAPVGLRRVRERAPELSTVLLVDGWPPRWSWHAGVRVVPGRPDTVGPSIDLIRERPQLVGWCHRAGLRVHVWTVNDDADVVLCRDLGVDAVITDRPEAARLLLGSSA